MSVYMYQDYSLGVQILCKWCRNTNIIMDAYEVPHIFVSEQDGMEALQQN